MANLHEYVLHRIFDYLTPLEWLQVSQVCKLWKEAASKQWRKITEMNYHYELDVVLGELLQNGNLKRENIHLPVISWKTAEKIMRHAAPFVKVLSASPYFERPEKLYFFGRFLYNVRGPDFDATTKLLAEHAVNLTEVLFKRSPTEESLKLFFNMNKHFPKLKKLDFEVGYKESAEVEPILSKILPYISHVKSLRICLFSSGDELTSCKSLLNVAKLSRLESFSFYSNVWLGENEGSSTFFNAVVLGCPELRVFKLTVETISEESFCTLLTLPHLEVVDVNLAVFHSVELSQTLNLTELGIMVDYTMINMTSFFKALKKMPKLKVLKIVTNNDDSASFASFSWKLICGVAMVAVSQGKILIVMKKEDKCHGRIIIRKKSEVYSDTEVLILKLEIPPLHLFAERVQTFVLKYLKRHVVIVCRCHLVDGESQQE